MNKTLLTTIIATAVIVGGGAFYGGIQYQKNQSPASKFGQTGSQRFAGMGANASSSRLTGQVGGMTTGDIIAKDAASITVKLRDGSSKIIFYSDTSSIEKSVSGTSGDLAVGKTVIVNGKTNSDGSITAQSIQLRTIPATPTAPTAQ